MYFLLVVITYNHDIFFEQLCCPNEWDFLPSLHNLGALAADGLKTVNAIIKFANSSGALVKKLVQYILHNNPTVQLAATGALR